MKTEEALTKLRDVIRLRHLSFATESAYCGWLRRFSAWLQDVRPAGDAAAKMGGFLTQLANQQVSSSTQNQAFNALLFWYREVLEVEVGEVKSLRAKIPTRIRVAPDRDQVNALLAGIQDVGGYPTRLIVSLLYGCGLRVSEPLNLRIKDVCLADSKLLIYGAKGAKDRVVPIPCSLAGAIKSQLAFAKGVAQRDIAARIPVALPGMLATKYPNLQYSPAWAWLFPAHKPCRHPRTQVLVRWRCLDVNVQRAVKAVAKRLGLDVTPHHLRHAYATHCLDRGVNPRALQIALGHKSLETTMGYCHADALSVASPMDAVT